MIRQKWKLRLELQYDEGFDEGVSQTNIELAGEHKGSKRPVNECIANDMANIIHMLLEGGAIVGSSDLNETAEAFVDTVNDIRKSNDC